MLSFRWRKFLIKGFILILSSKIMLFFSFSIFKSIIRILHWHKRMNGYSIRSHYFRRFFYFFCQTSVLSLKTWSWLCFTHVTRTRTRTTTTHQISQLLLTRFWPNFKRRFLGTSRTDSNCHSNICPDNICPGGICPHQEYLSCYWLDLDQTLKVCSWDNL